MAPTVIATRAIILLVMGVLLPDAAGVGGTAAPSFDD
jgi:hypothetical protein